MEWVYEERLETEVEREKRLGKRTEPAGLGTYLTVLVLANVVVYLIFSSGC